MASRVPRLPISVRRRQFARTRAWRNYFGAPRRVGAGFVLLALRSPREGTLLPALAVGYYCGADEIAPRTSHGARSARGFIAGSAAHHRRGFQYPARLGVPRSNA